MLVEKDTNRILITDTQMKDEPIVTDDGIFLNNEYSLVYEYEGRNPVVFTLSGVDIALNYQTIINIFDMGDKLDLVKVREFINPFVVLWGKLTTDNKLLKEVNKDYNPDYIRFVKSAIKGNREDKELLDKYISAYLYIMLLNRSDDEYDLCCLHILDHEPDRDFVEQVIDAWRESHFVISGEVTSYEDMYNFWSTRGLKCTWISDPKEVMQIH